MPAALKQRRITEKPLPPRPRNVKDWSRARLARVEKLVEHSNAVLEGKAELWKRPYPGTTSAEKRKAIEKALKADPFVTHRQIEAMTGVSIGTAARIRREMIAAGEIQDVTRSEKLKHMKRDPKRITNALSEKEIVKRITGRSRQIKEFAKYIRMRNRTAFDALGISANSIAAEIRERMRWKLQTFDPKRMHGDEKTKVERFISANLTNLKMELERSAWRQFESMQKAKEKPVKKEKPKSEARKEEERRRRAFKGLSVAQIEGISSRLKLDPLRKATVYALAAGLSPSYVAEELGVTSGRVTQLRRELAGELERLKKKKEI